MRLVINIPIILAVLAAGYVFIFMGGEEAPPHANKCAWEPPLKAENVPLFNPACTPQSMRHISFENSDGTQGTLNDHKGRVVVLNFWATWCGPCRTEMPTLENLQEKFDKNEVEVLALSLDDDTMYNAALFLNQLGVENLTHVHNPKGGIQAGVNKYPTTMILDRNGNMLGRMEGQYEWDSRAAVDLVRQALIFSDIEGQPRQE